MCIGAILTQNTSWGGVETAIRNLKEKGLLAVPAIAGAPADELEAAIRPAGTFRVKARYLQALARAAHSAGGLATFLHGPLEVVRERLLALPGIGEETADAILLYGAHQPSFVIDAYTRRLGVRLGLTRGGESYSELQRLWSAACHRSAEAFQWAHAWMVEHAKRTCRARRPACGRCALSSACRRVGLDDPSGVHRVTRLRPGASVAPASFIATGFRGPLKGPALRPNRQR